MEYLEVLAKIKDKNVMGDAVQHQLHHCIS